MEILNQATKTNREGVALLSLGQPTNAYQCFKEALGLVASLSNRNLPHAPEALTPALVPPLLIAPLSSFSTESDPLTSSCCEDKICLILLADQEGIPYPCPITSELASMCAVAIIANCAVACEHQACMTDRRHAAEVLYDKAYTLYRQCMELMAQAQHCFDCSSLLQAITHHMAGCLHELGDFQGVRNLLDTIFQGRVYDLAVVEMAQASIYATAA